MRRALIASSGEPVARSEPDGPFDPGGTHDPALTIRLFGAPSVDVGGAAVPWDESRKALELLAWLCLHGPAEVDREVCAGVLWPDSDRKHALGSLRRALHVLGQFMRREACRLQADRRAIALDVRDARVDVVEFDSAILRGDEASLTSAVEVYRGPLLQGWATEWVCEHRAAREQKWLTALQRLATGLIARGAPELALPHLQRLLVADPLREAAACALMGIHASAGRYVDAIRVYQSLRAQLNVHLELEPDRDTTELYAAIRRQARSDAPRDHRLREAPIQPLELRNADASGARPLRLAGVLTIGARQTPVELQLPALPGLPESGWRLELSSVASSKDGNE
jgi:DNA-binding SARP family transcriptional activator